MVRARAHGRAVLAISIAGAMLLPDAVGGQSAPQDAGLAIPLWRDATATTTGPTAGWTNKVEVADVDGDGLLDIVHANGGEYESPGTPERQGVFRNAGDGTFQDVTDQVFGDDRYLARVIKARDVTGDRIVDLLVGTTFQNQTQLFRGLGGGAFENVTSLLLPSAKLSVGDLEVGDVDGDGDLDIVLADWGNGSPMDNAGGAVRLWRNTGEGWAEDPDAMPAELIGFSWDLELVDVDLDWDLDVAVSCKVCVTSRLYLNDGGGVFRDVSAERLPAFGNNYEFEAMDLDGDLDPELVTINDGAHRPSGLAEHVFRNDGGTFVDVTDDWWPAAQNPGYDDNVVAFLDAELDGDADFLIGSLDGPDRLIRQRRQRTPDDGGHRDRRAPEPRNPGIALGDLDGDGRLDVAEGSGEVTDADHVYLATDSLPPDTLGPTIGAVTLVEPEAGTIWVQARVHDRKTPVLSSDFKEVTARLGSGPDAVELPMNPYGADLWRAVFEWDGPAPRLDDVQVCAVDRVDNRSCS